MRKNGRASFRLYVVANQTNSIAALANLKAMCSTFLSGQCDIEIVDVRREPKRALLDGIAILMVLRVLLAFNAIANTGPAYARRAA